MDDFATFGASHWVMLGVFVAGTVPAVALGRAVRDDPARRLRRSRTAAVVLVGFMVPAQAVDLLPGQFDFGTSLPIQLCDLAWMATAVALWTHHRFPVALTYFWGLVLTTQGILTPALDSGFPSPKFVAFWGMHLLIVWAAVYLTFGLRLTVRWRDYATTVATTAVWAALVYAFDLATDTNYGFLVRKPESSVLDHLGPWPWYVLAEIAILATVWALMTWPWHRGRDRGVAVRRTASR